MVCKASALSLERTRWINAVRTLRTYDLVMKRFTPIINVSNRKAWNHTEFHRALDLLWGVDREMLDTQTTRFRIR